MERGSRVQLKNLLTVVLRGLLNSWPRTIGHAYTVNLRQSQDVVGGLIVVMIAMLLIYNN